MNTFTSALHGRLGARTPRERLINPFCSAQKENLFSAETHFFFHRQHDLWEPGGFTDVPSLNLGLICLASSAPRFSLFPLILYVSLRSGSAPREENERFAPDNAAQQQLHFFMPVKEGIIENFVYSCAIHSGLSKRINKINTC